MTLKREMFTVTEALAAVKSNLRGPKFFKGIVQQCIHGNCTAQSFVSNCGLVYARFISLVWSSGLAFSHCQRFVEISSLLLMAQQVSMHSHKVTSTRLTGVDGVARGECNPLNVAECNLNDNIFLCSVVCILAGTA